MKKEEENIWNFYIDKPPIGKYETSDSGGEKNILYYNGKSWYKDKNFKDKYEYFISYWRYIKPFCVEDNRINIMDNATTTTQESLSERPLSFGEQFVGITFNPSQDFAVHNVKNLCAQLADIVAQQGNPDSSFMFNLIRESALKEILNAQMNIVKLLTLKY